VKPPDIILKAVRAVKIHNFYPTSRIRI